MKIDTIEDIEMVPEWIRAAWEKKNLAPNETLRGLFLEKEQIKRRLGGWNWAWFLIISVVLIIVSAITTSYGLSKLDTKWFLAIPWLITCIVVILVLSYFLAKNYNNALNELYKRSSYIADKLAMFKSAREGLDQVYDKRPEQMKIFLLHLAVEVIFSEQNLRIIRFETEKSIDELGSALERERHYRQKFDHTILTLHDSFGLFPELTRPEIFRRAEQMIAKLRKA